MPAIEVLVVCTGNICRSPMAEAMLADRVRARRLDVHVSSAGLLTDHEPAHPSARDTLARLGLDLSLHRSRLIDAEIVGQSDLIIGMEVRHVREVTMVEPSAFGRTFTLPELVARAEKAGPRLGAFDDWLAEVGRDRTPSEVIRLDRELEVPDPMGMSKRTFRKVSDQLVDLVDRLMPLAWPEAAPTGHHGPAHETMPGSI